MAHAMTRDGRIALAVTIGLGVSMTVGYGVLYYSFAALAPSIMTEFGWTRGYVFGVFSAALLAGGLVAPFTGGLIDRYGARPVMAAGSLAATAALAGLSLVEGPVGFAVLIVAAEMIALTIQYEAGFAALAQYHGQAARGPITGVTLIAGFSSTIFWPLIAWLLQWLTWREVYLVLAAINLAVAFPVHVLLPRPTWRAPVAGDVPAGSLAKVPVIPPETERRRILVLLALAFTGSGFVISAVQSSFLLILGDFGYAPAVAASLGALIGPSQVGARVLEMTWGRRHSPVKVGIWATAITVLGVLLLMLAPLGAWAAIAFALFYGAGQGLAYIVRGVVPLHFFGPSGYGALVGKLTLFRVLFSAAAPVTVALATDAGGPHAALAMMALLGCGSVAAMVALLRIDVARTASAY